MSHLNTKCALGVSILTAVTAAAPALLPLHTLEATTYLWVAGGLALTGVALNVYNLATHREDPPSTL